MISIVSTALPRLQSQSTRAATGSGAAFSLPDEAAVRDWAREQAQGWASPAHFNLLRETLVQLRAYEAGETDALVLGGQEVSLAETAVTENGVTVLGTFEGAGPGGLRTGLFGPDALQTELDLMRQHLADVQRTAQVTQGLAEGARRNLAELNRSEDPAQYDDYVRALAALDTEAVGARIQAEVFAEDWGPKLKLLGQVLDAMWDLVPGAERTVAAAETGTARAAPAETAQTSGTAPVAAASEPAPQSEADRKKAARQAAQAMDEAWERVKELLSRLQPAEAAPGSEAAARAWDAARAAIKVGALPQASA